MIYKTIKAAVRTAKREEAHIQVTLVAAELGLEAGAAAEAELPGLVEEEPEPEPEPEPELEPLVPLAEVVWAAAAPVAVAEPEAELARRSWR